MDALLRRRAMIAAGGGSPTPPGPVTTIPYIRGGANGSYIDTGITPDNTTKVIVWARNFNPGAGNLFGSRTSSTSNRFCLLTPGSANLGRIRLDYGNATDTYADDQFANLSHYHKYELYQGVLKIDDVTVVSSTTQPTFSGTYNLFLFGNNNAGTLQSLNFPADICACQIYKGGTLVRDFTPVSSPSVGLYDAVSETVFTNAGAGAFTYGTFNSSAYIPLEYIECDAQQYFDTGVLGAYDLPITVNFMPTNTTAMWAMVLGYRTSTSCCDISLGTATAGQENIRCYWRFGTSDTSVQAYNNTNIRLTNRNVIAVKNNDVLTIYFDNAQKGTGTRTTSSSFQTDGTMFVGTINSGGSPNSSYFQGRYYYLNLGTQRNYVPAKVSGVAGMYDTYNDVFKPSVSGTPFIAGPELN